MTMASASDPLPDPPAASLRRMAASLLALVQARAEMFAVELQEEKLRLLHLLAWFAVAVALGTAGVLVVIGALALQLWQLAGVAGLGGLALVTIGSAAGILTLLRRHVLHVAAPFAATLGEFRKDAQALRHSP